MRLGQTLRSLRESRGWSRATLAAKSGISETYIEAIERGDRGKRVSATVILKLSEALEVQPGDLDAEYAKLDRNSETALQVLERLRHHLEAVDLISIPVAGYVPSRAQGEVRGQSPEHIQVPRALVEKEGSTIDTMFALEVADALPEEGIYWGDYIIVRPGVSVDDGGGLFVVEVDGQRLLRRVRRAGPYLHVRPMIGDRAMLLTNDVSIIGKVVAGGRWREF